MAGKSTKEEYESFSEYDFWKRSNLYPDEIAAEYRSLNISFPDADVFQREENKRGKLYKMIAWISTREYHVWQMYGLPIKGVKLLIRLARANQLHCLVAVMEFYRLTSHSLGGKSHPIDELCNIGQISWEAIFPLIAAGKYTKLFAEWDGLREEDEDYAINQTGKSISQCCHGVKVLEHPFTKEFKPDVVFEESVPQEELQEPSRKKKKWF